MWLIETSSLKLEQVVDPLDRKFAILSHTWDVEGEVTFQDMQDLDIARSKPGFLKIEKTCNVARRHFKYVWIDTCCIDKSSSAELSEAINSMFYWYKCSKLCFVFLSDFEPLPLRMKEHERRSLVDVRLSKCRWFTRGWTLQELIAPTRLEFFDRDWTFIGGKSGLEATLALITNVDISILKDSARLSLIPVARRMSWAARRETTRIEDMAYCLLGIFDINMPLLYGEGTKAFYRLQQQLASENNDLSLFAWQKNGGLVSHKVETIPEFGGIFADSPDDFRVCSTLKRHHDQFLVENQFTITNTGLRMDATLYPCRSPDSKRYFLLGLDCVETSERTNRRTLWIAIYLRRIENTYVRARLGTVATAVTRTAWIQGSAKPTIYIRTRLLSDDIRRIQSSFQTGIVLVYDKALSGIVVSRVGKPESYAYNMDGYFVFHINGRDNFLGLHKLSLQISPSEGHTRDFVVVCCLQWTGTSCVPRFAIYSDTDKSENVRLNNDGDKLSRDYAKIIMELLSSQSPTTETDCLKEVKDMMMTRYSDLSGSLIQESMPTEAKVTPRRGAGGHYQLNIKKVTRNDCEELVDIAPQGEYFYAIIEYEYRPGIHRSNAELIPYSSSAYEPFMREH